jgi:protein O-mannosyl-transferase
MSKAPPIAAPGGKARPQAHPGRRGWLASPVAASLLLVCVTAAVYWPVARFDFINLDDSEYVISNPQVQNGLTTGGFLWAFGVGYAANWHPLTWLSHMLDVTLFGKSAAGPHVMNLLLHAANAVLLFILLRRLTGAHYRSLMVAALFALHPLHVESVAWISERKDVLSALFFMLTLLAYAKYAEQAGSGGSQGSSVTQRPESAETRHHLRSAFHIPGFALPASRYYWLSLLCFALGLMCKPMLVTVPFVMLLLDYWPLGRWGRSAGGTLGSAGKLIWEKASFLAAALASCVVTLAAQTQALQPLTSFSVAARAQNALVAAWLYLWKSFWPVGLALPYPHPGTWPGGTLGLALAVLAVLAVAGWCWGRQRPYLRLGLLWFFGMLVPVIGLVQVGEQAMADRYMYLPQTGLCLAVVWGAAELAGRARLSRAVIAGFCAVLLLACAARTRDQLAYWRDSETLFRHSAAVTGGNAAAYYSLGLHYSDVGRTDEALANYLKALGCNPNHATARVNLGALLAQEQRFAEADEQFQAALKIAPQSPLVLNNVGVALAGQGRFAEAVSYYDTARLA